MEKHKNKKARLTELEQKREAIKKQLAQFCWKDDKKAYKNLHAMLWFVRKKIRELGGEDDRAEKEQSRSAKIQE